MTRPRNSSGAGGGQLGNVEAGALGSLTTPTISAFAGGLATIVGTAVIGLALPAFIRYRHQPHDPADENQNTPAAAAT